MEATIDNLSATLLAGIPILLLQYIGADLLTLVQKINELQEKLHFLKELALDLRNYCDIALAKYTQTCARQKLF